MTALGPQRHRMSLGSSLRRTLVVLLLVVGSACGTDFLRVETVNPPPTTTTSTSTTTTTQPKPTTTTTRKAPSSTTTSSTRPKSKVALPPPVATPVPGLGPQTLPPTAPAPPTMSASPL